MLGAGKTQVYFDYRVQLLIFPAAVLYQSNSSLLLRHSSLATTAKHYIKDVPENTQEAMNRLEQLFNDCSTTRH